MTTEVRSDGRVVTAESSDSARSVASVARAKRQRAWRVNHRLLLWSVLILAVGATTIYFWHRYQLQAQADALFDRALSLHKQEDWKAAAASFHQYLQLRNENDAHYSEALLYRAQDFAKVARSPDRVRRAISFYSAAIPKNDEATVRLEYAELLHTAGRHAEALRLLDQDRGALIDDVKAARIWAFASRDRVGLTLLESQADDIVSNFEAGLARHPGDIPLSVGLATFLRANYSVFLPALHERALPLADRVMDAMVAAHPDDLQALLARYQYRKANDLPDAQVDLARAVRLAPDDADVLRASALAAAERGSKTDSATARRIVERLLRAAPDDRRSYLVASTVFTRIRDLPAAVNVLDKGLKSIGADDVELHRTLVRTVVAKRDPAAAESALTDYKKLLDRVSPYLTGANRRQLYDEFDNFWAEFRLLPGDYRRADEAISILRRLSVTATETRSAEETARANERRRFMLAAAYASADRTRDAAAVLNRLLEEFPRRVDLRLAAAAEFRRAGELNDAIRNYRSATVLNPESADAWLGLAEALMEQQQQRAAAGEESNWDGVNSALGKARAVLSKRGQGQAPVLLTVEAAAALARGDRAASSAKLDEMLAIDELSPGALPRVALLLADCGEQARAKQVVERYRDALEDWELVDGVADLLLADVQRRGGDLEAAAQSLEALESRLKGKSQDGKKAKSSDTLADGVLQRLIDVKLALGEVKYVRGRLRELRDAGRHEKKIPSARLWIYEMSGDLAILAGDRSDLGQVVNELENVAGETAQKWRSYFRAMDLLEVDQNSGKGAKPNGANLPAALRLLGDLEQEHPDWARISLLRGRIAERSGRLADASAEYEQSLRDGVSRLIASQWLISALYKQNRFADAAKFFGRGGLIAAASPAISTLAIPAAIKAGRPEDALRIARLGVELRPKDLFAHIQFGQALALSNRADEAEAELKKAVDLDRQDARGWSSLVWFYGREKRQDDARKTLDRMVKTIEKEPYEQQLILARGKELIGDRVAAEKHYASAIELRPQDAAIWEELGRFHLRSDRDKALNAYQRALDINKDSKEARTFVAVLMGARGTDQEVSRAIDLLGESNPSPTALDRRLQVALLLSRRSPDAAESYQRAVEIAEALVNENEPPAPDDRLLLARALEAVSRMDDAQVQFEMLAKERESPPFIVALAEFLVRRGNLEQADVWVKRLEDLEPANNRTLEARLSWLLKAGKSDQIDPVVDRFVKAQEDSAKADPTQATAKALAYAGGLLTQIKQYDEAEKQFRKLANVAPDGYRFLAVWLAERGRASEAIKLCLDRVSTSVDPVGSALALIRVCTVAANRADAALDNPAAEQALEAAAATPQATAELLLELGVLRVMQGRDQEAISLYERALALKRGNPAVLNNLALSLVEVPGRQQEALECIDKALELAPGLPELLDTKSLVLIGLGRFDESRQILDRLCQGRRVNSRYLLHLAMALSGLNDGEQARSLLERARRGGLEKELLTPSERRLMARIDQ
ncbi:MAG: tetratricopeptide repeat protein [Planctomycetaceae bacterium]